MTVLVTGGSGFVGLNLVEALLQEGERVVSFANEPIPRSARERFAVLSGSLEEVIGDISVAEDIAACVAKYRPGIVIHLAAVTRDTLGERADPGQIALVNIVGAVNVIQQIRRLPDTRFILGSSISVYGRLMRRAGLVLEDAGSLPSSVYGISKDAAERICLRLAEARDFNVTIARLGAVYGPWEWATAARDTPSPMAQAVRVARAGMKGSLSPPGTIDWVYSRDVARALIALASKSPTTNDVVNVGTGRVTTVLEWCSLLKTRFPAFDFEVADSGAAVNIDSYQQLNRSPLSNERLANLIGPMRWRSTAEAFEDYMEWFDSTRDW